MTEAAYQFRTQLWLHQGEAAWHFVTVPGEVSDDIEARTAHQRRGFGSARVRVTVGATTWQTSVFPDKQREAYVLPVKKDVRRAEGIEAGDDVALTLELLDV